MSARTTPTPKCLQGTLLAACAVAASLSPRESRAADRYWNVSTGVWSQASNWNPAAVPGPSDNAVINLTDALARVTTSTIGPVASAIISNNATVRLTNQGSLVCHGDFIVGAFNTRGTLNIQTTNPVLAFPGALTVNGNLRLGVLGGIGHLNQDAGRLIVGGDIVLGEQLGSPATLVPTGEYRLSDAGSVQATRLLVGYHPDASGYVNVSGNAAVSVQYLYVGGGRYGGTVEQSGGQVNVSGKLTLDSSNLLDNGRYTISGGSLACGSSDIYDRTTFNYNGGAVSLGDIYMSGGKIKVSPHGDKLLRGGRLFMESDATIDLANNAMLLTAEAPESVGAYISYGYGAGGWDGSGGITSSFAAATALLGLPHRTALGYGPSGEGTLVKYTYAGDATLDGTVNLQDFNRLASHFGSTQAQWHHGDFNYDRSVNLQDFNLLASNFGLSASGTTVTPQDWSALAGAVPEPAALASPVLLATLLTRRRHALPRGLPMRNSLRR